MIICENEISLVCLDMAPLARNTEPTGTSDADKAQIGRYTKGLTKFTMRPFFSRPFTPILRPLDHVHLLAWTRRRASQKSLKLACRCGKMETFPARNRESTDPRPLPSKNLQSAHGEHGPDLG
jgi:hypothetical protein